MSDVETLLGEIAGDRCGRRRRRPPAGMDGGGRPAGRVVRRGLRASAGSRCGPTAAATSGPGGATPTPPSRPRPRRPPTTRAASPPRCRPRSPRTWPPTRPPTASRPTASRPTASRPTERRPSRRAPPPSTPRATCSSSAPAGSSPAATSTPCPGGGAYDGPLGVVDRARRHRPAARAGLRAAPGTRRRALRRRGGRPVRRPLHREPAADRPARTRRRPRPASTPTASPTARPRQGGPGPRRDRARRRGGAPDRRLRRGARRAGLHAGGGGGRRPARRLRADPAARALARRHAPAAATTPAPPGSPTAPTRCSSSPASITTVRTVGEPAGRARHGRARWRCTPTSRTPCRPRVRAWVDVRADTPGQVKSVVSELRGRRVRPRVEESWTPATPFGAPLTDRVARVAGDAAGRRPRCPCSPPAPVTTRACWPRRASPPP